MLNLTIEIFGLPSNITSLRSVQVILNDDAGISDLVAELRRTIPALEGTVIRKGEDRLIDYYGLNINGHFYRQKEEIKLKESDHIALLVLASGG